MFNAYLSAVSAFPFIGPNWTSDSNFYYFGFTWSNFHFLIIFSFYFEALFGTLILGCR